MLFPGSGNAPKYSSKLRFSFGMNTMWVIGDTGEPAARVAAGAPGSPENLSASVMDAKTPPPPSHRFHVRLRTTPRPSPVEAPDPATPTIRSSAVARVCADGKGGSACWTALLRARRVPPAGRGGKSLEAL